MIKEILEFFRKSVDSVTIPSIKVPVPETLTETKSGKPTKMSPLGMAELIDYECLCLQPYLDSGGVKTVGAGSTVSDIPDLPKWSWSRSITIEEALNYFKAGLSKYEAALNKALKVNVTQNEYDALVSITYNIGTGGMQKSTFMKRLNAEASPQSVVEAMKRYKYDNGKVVQGLINRRQKEADLYMKGTYKSKGVVSLVPVSSGHKPLYSKGTRVNVLKYLE